MTKPNNTRLISMLFIFILFNVFILKSQTIQIPWNKDQGIPFHQSYDLNTGFHSFVQIDNNQLAFLLKEDKIIRFFDMYSGTKIRDININISAYDLTYNNNTFYLLANENVEIINLTTGIHNIVHLNSNNVYFEKIKSSNNHIYLYSNNQETWEIKSENNNPVCVSTVGMELFSGLNCRSIKTSNHSFSIEINNTKNLYQTVKKLASSVIAGTDSRHIYVDVQFIEHEIPLKVSREIWIFQLNQNGQLSEPSKIYIPNCYFTYSKHDIFISETNSLYALTDPDGVKIFDLNTISDIQIKNKNIDYHYNFNTLPSLEKSESYEKNNKAAITRAQIIANAEPFETHSWFCNASNIKDYSCGGKQVVTPIWVTVGPHVAVPYMWGGWSNLTQFDQGIASNVSAGDCNTTGGSAGSSCAVGVDCSGYVSRAWNLSSKYGTSTLPNISPAYSSYSQLLPGDIVNYAGHHVRLIHTLNTNGTFLVLEASASATDWRVGYSTYSVSDLQGVYIPRYYQDVINASPDTISPQTTISTNNWETSDFTATFYDTDNYGIQDRFWLPVSLNNTNWNASRPDGFLYEDFTDTITPIWTLIEPTWGIHSGVLSQTNQSLTNNNAYTDISQDSTTQYMYHWKMKLTGTSGDKRAGIYLFSDSATALQRNNAYMVYYRSDLDVCQIYKSVNNSITLMTEDPCVIDGTNWFDCKVTYNPSTGVVTAYLNDKPVTSWTDLEPLKLGRYISLRTGSCNALFDEFRIYKSRTTSANVTVGLGKMLPDENGNPSSPSCKIYSAVIDLAENISVSNNFTNIDITSPLPISMVSDNNPMDADTSNNNSILNVYWNSSTDPNSGVNEYFYALGSTPGGTDIIPFTNLVDTFAICNSLFLQNYQTYYFTVKATNNAGLESAITTSDGIYIDNLQELIKNQFESSILLFPNPAKNELCLNWENKTENITIKIFDELGIEQFTVSTFSNNKYVLNVENLQNGIYYCQILTNNNKLFQKKFIILK